MHGLGGVQEKRGAAGGAERCGDLLRDDSAFAHAGDDYASAALTTLQNASHGAVEGRFHGAFKALGERQQSFRFNAN
jgi:hypothetical protein